MRMVYRALTAAGVCLLMAGCATMHERDVRVDEPVLPTPIALPFTAKVGVYFSEDFRSAAPQSSYGFAGDTYAFRHVIGAASVATFRQALAGSFDAVVELRQWPAAPAAVQGLAAVVIPSVPTAASALYYQIFSYTVDLYAPTGELLAQWNVMGTATLEPQANAFATRQEPFDGWAMRAAGAALVASFRREPALTALRSVGAIPREPAEVSGGSPRGEGIVALDLDAGRANDDVLEQRVVDCIASSLPPPRHLEQDQPAFAVRNALFPWLDPGVVPERSDEMVALLANPWAQDRLARLGVSHLVLFRVRHADLTGINKGGCVGGMGAGACFGQWESGSTDTMDAAVWDVAARRLLPIGPVQTKRKIGALGLGLPIPYWSSNKQEACDQLKKLIREAISTPR